MKNLLCISDGKSNEIVIHAYRSNIHLDLTWSSCLKYIFFIHGFGEIWENRIKTFRSIGATQIINQRVIDCSDQNNPWMLKSQPKMRTYCAFKNTFKIENDILSLKSIEKRTLLSKFRLSDHRLEVDVSRYHRPKKNPEERLCPSCNILEDEINCLMACDINREIR